MKFLRRLFHAQQRRTDLAILWPSLKDMAPNIEEARLAFFLHASDDPCWTEKYTSEELLAYIETLT